MNIYPILNFTLGREPTDSLNRKLFQNTRGVKIDVNLFENFSFSTALVENQARYCHYETNRYLTYGELYPAADSTYFTQNAVVPGSTRTKFFKSDGFDYAYAIGSMSYRPFRKLTLFAGNNQQFIGSGYRSLFLSDNTSQAPYYRADYQFASKWAFSYYRARHLNLLRRPFTSSAEAYYEAKGYSVNYLSYSPHSKLVIGLFDGAVWNRGDSITSRSSHPLYYSPVPILSALLLANKNEMASVLGLNVAWTIHRSHLIYGQFAWHNLNLNKVAVQLGYRGSKLFGVKDLFVQAEANMVPAGFYESVNPRLNYIHYNLPLAHPQGQGFTEVMLRVSYEWKRVYIRAAEHYYLLSGFNEADLLPIYDTLIGRSGAINWTEFELGYRFNRKMNLCIFTSLISRIASADQEKSTIVLSGGLRTALFNHYRDF